MRQFCKGSSLVEYALIGLLVLAASIGGFLLIGQNLDSVLAAFRGDMEKPVQTAALVSQQMADAAEAQAAAEAAAAITPGGVGGIVPAPTGSQAQLCAEGGVCMNIPVYPAGTEQVAGANGGSFTNQYASALQSIADQLAAQSADPALVDLITKAANAGNTLGNAETKMIELCYPDARICNYSDSAENLNYAKGVCNDVLTQSSNFTNAWNQLNSYLSSHPEAMTPAVVEFIRLNGGEITQIGDQYEHQANQALNGNFFDEPNMMFDQTLQNTDVVTKTDAENICNTDKGCEIQQG